MQKLATNKQQAVDEQIVTQHIQWDICVIGPQLVNIQLKHISMRLGWARHIATDNLKCRHADHLIITEGAKGCQSDNCKHLQS